MEKKGIYRSPCWKMEEDEGDYFPCWNISDWGTEAEIYANAFIEDASTFRKDDDKKWLCHYLFDDIGGTSRTFSNKNLLRSSFLYLVECMKTFSVTYDAPFNDLFIYYHCLTDCFPIFMNTDSFPMKPYDYGFKYSAYVDIEFVTRTKSMLEASFNIHNHHEIRVVATRVAQYICCYSHGLGFNCHESKHDIMEIGEQCIKLLSEKLFTPSDI
jgi:hypothetical protein